MTKPTGMLDLRDGSLESRVGPRLPPLSQMLAADVEAGDRVQFKPPIGKLWSFGDSADSGRTRTWTAQ